MKDNQKNNLNEEIEKQLLSRLRQMGILLVGFCLCTFIYGMFLDPPAESDLLEEKELSSGFSLLSKDGRVNAFGVAGAFFVVGSTCMFISSKRKMP